MMRIHPLLSVHAGTSDWWLAFACHRFIVEVRETRGLTLEQRRHLMASYASERDLCALRAACALPWPWVADMAWGAA